MSHIGIELRARLLDCPPDQQVILLADSDRLHSIAERSAADALAPAGWREVKPGEEVAHWAQTLPPILDHEGKPVLQIEHRAVWLREDPEREIFRLIMDMTNAASGYRNDMIELTEDQRKGLLSAAVQLAAALDND